MPHNYNQDPVVFSTAEALAQDPDAIGKFYKKTFELTAATADDFAGMEGGPESPSVFWVNKDTAVNGVGRVKLSTLGVPSGPGARGETPLIGNTSTPRIGGYTVDVDFWRDAVELTKKQVMQLAAGGQLEFKIRKLLGEKYGRQKQSDMMMALMRQANGNRTFGGGAATRDTITKDGLFTLDEVVAGKAFAGTLGARPISISKSKSGSPNFRYIAFATQNSMNEIQSSSAYQTAVINGGERGDMNPAFSGKLVDWRGIGLWEHTVVMPDTDDVLGSPIEPLMRVGVAITDSTAAFEIKSSATNTKNLYSSFFPGYDWKWTEDQTAAPDSTTYYAWILPRSGANLGKAMFVSYVGTGNNGNKITVTNRLGASAAVDQVTTLGGITWNSSHHCTSAPVGSLVIPANAKGTPVADSFIFGAGAALRAYGSIDLSSITRKDDYDFVMGFGYEGIFGQTATKDTQGLTRNYVHVVHAIERQGIVIPGTYGV